MVCSLYRLRFPERLYADELKFGRDYTQLSKVFNTTLDLIYDKHKDKVAGNLNWYSDRFDMYNEIIRSKIASLNNGLIPREVADVFAFLDGHGKETCRMLGLNNIQNSFWNKYFHKHILIWLALTFPDGMVVLENPFPGFMTDPMCWRDSVLRQEMNFVIQNRVNAGQGRLKLYADKIFITDLFITAAYSLRNGVLPNWMIDINFLMSKVRVCVEWSFMEICSYFKFTDYIKTQKLMLSPLEKQFVVSVLFVNVHICYYGHSQTNEYFDIDPPTVDDYFNQ